MALAGVTVGRSIIDVAPRFGPPGVFTEDWGFDWQWPDSGGLDREVTVDENMLVERVLVAPGATASSSSTGTIAQPPELPILRLARSAAEDAVAKLGGTELEPRLANTLVWRLHGGIVAANLTNGAVTAVIAFDERAAHRFGYLSPPLSVAPFKAPIVVKDAVPHNFHASGTMVVRAIIDATGKVSDARIIISSGSSALDAIELQRLRNSTYKPASCAGIPCASVYMEANSYWVGPPPL